MDRYVSNVNAFLFQIVIQVGEEKDGVVLIRTGANDKKYACPIKYLKEI